MKNVLEFLKKPEDLPMLKPKRYSGILVLAPHCDDEAIGCGGTILKYLSMGTSVTIVFLTNQHSPKKEIREKESQMAWENYPEVKLVYLNFLDTFLYKEERGASFELRKIIEQINPEMILLPWIGDEHPDHNIVLKLLGNSINNTQNIDLYFYEIFYPLPCNYLINITDYFGEKVRIMNQYGSQKRLNFIETATYLNGYRAACIALSKVKYAEAFFVSKTGCMDSLIEIMNE